MSKKFLFVFLYISAACMCLAEESRENLEQVTRATNGVDLHKPEVKQLIETVSKGDIENFRKLTDSIISSGQHLTDNEERYVIERCWLMGNFNALAYLTSLITLDLSQIIKSNIYQTFSLQDWLDQRMTVQHILQTMGEAPEEACDLLKRIKQRTPCLLSLHDIKIIIAQCDKVLGSSEEKRRYAKKIKKILGVVEGIAVQNAHEGYAPLSPSDHPGWLEFLYQPTPRDE